MDPALATVLVVITSAVVLVLGGVVTHLAYRAARRSGSPVMRRFAAGFGLVTLGLLLGGGAHQLLGWRFLDGVLLQRIVTVLGFGLLVHSLYSHADPEPASRS
ncbi:DUF7521 family protein [Haloarcula nitratireducens]|uniref:YapH protein n=1 Tax=Haloarcula nitratireducens TaxID=2487749 RepID=A0AAW4PE42_9EURY|nr:hypothetical protein [Halomicroarcula nitratireducens]MBX0295930.1 hypothetical protein [Halomicroarcula nitratireducens]